MADGTRLDNLILGPQAKRDTNHFLDCCELILTNHLNQYISSPQPYPLSIALCWKLGRQRSALWHPDEVWRGPGHISAGDGAAWSAYLVLQRYHRMYVHSWEADTSGLALFLMPAAH
ncbi:MAG: hypothetical protein BVN28_05970 [Nitrospira sp. ST-bin4]|nr:MAG: hypothetical protein BVN28_05970 [Nitrospira sp. ST-bin4]